MAAAASLYGAWANDEVHMRVFMQACVLGICEVTAVPVIKDCDETFEETGENLDNAASNPGGGSGIGGGGGWGVVCGTVNGWPGGCEWVYID